MVVNRGRNLADELKVGHRNRWKFGRKEDGCLFTLGERSFFLFLSDIIMQGTDRNSFLNVGVQFC